MINAHCVATIQGLVTINNSMASLQTHISIRLDKCSRNINDICFKYAKFDTLNINYQMQRKCVGKSIIIERTGVQ